MFQFMSLRNLNLFTDKVISKRQLGQIIKIEREKKKDLKIVFTNGCFDIIHSGHVNYLKAAKRLSDILILALNSDSSGKKIKRDKTSYK